jgi:UDP-N-acetylmuramate--alanine ligase
MVFRAFISGSSGFGVAAFDAVPLPGTHVHLPGSLDEAAEVVAGLAGPGDLVLTLGAGDVTTVGPAVLAVLGGARG